MGLEGLCPHQLGVRVLGTASGVTEVHEGRGPILCEPRGCGE